MFAESTCMMRGGALKFTEKKKKKKKNVGQLQWDHKIFYTSNYEALFSNSMYSLTNLIKDLPGCTNAQS